MDRYTLLFSIVPGVDHPFGEEIFVPDIIGDTFSFVLEPLGVKASPVPRFQPLPTEGTYQQNLQERQKAVTFDLEKPGREALERIVDQWTALLRSGYKYAAVDIPLHEPANGH